MCQNEDSCKFLEFKIIYDLLYFPQIIYSFLRGRKETFIHQLEMLSGKFTIHTLCQCYV